MNTDESAGDVEIQTTGERPVYVAKSLADAQRLEAVFAAAGVEFDVEPDTYRGGLIFSTTRVGAFFYVTPELRERAVAVMQENGFKPALP